MKVIRVALFGSLLIIFFIGILVSQPPQKPMFPEEPTKPPSLEKILTIEEWLNNKSELEKSIEESDEIGKEVNQLIVKLSEKKQEISKISQELDKLIKRREIAELSRELHKSIMRSEDLLRRTRMLGQGLLSSIAEISNTLEKTKEQVQIKLDEAKKQGKEESVQSYEKELKKIEEQLSTLKEFEKKYKEEFKLLDEKLENQPPFLSEGMEEESFMSKEPPLISDEELRVKFNELPPGKKLILWRLMKRIERLERENQFLIEKAQQNAEEIRKISESLKLGIDSEKEIPSNEPEPRGQMHRKRMMESP